MLPSTWKFESKMRTPPRSMRVALRSSAGLGEPKATSGPWDRMPVEALYRYAKFPEDDPPCASTARDPSALPPAVPFERSAKGYGYWVNTPSRREYLNVSVKPLALLSPVVTTALRSFASASWLRKSDMNGGALVDVPAASVAELNGMMARSEVASSFFPSRVRTRSRRAGAWTFAGADHAEPEKV